MSNFQKSKDKCYLNLVIKNVSKHFLHSWHLELTMSLKFRLHVTFLAQVNLPQLVTWQANCFSFNAVFIVEF